MKKTSTIILRNSLLLLATILGFSAVRASAQTTAQTKLAAPRITQAIDESRLVPMHSKVHPLARAEFDRGAVPDSQPMNRIILDLQRGPDQETALRNLMDEQQTKNSPNYHAWLTPSQFGQQFGVSDADVQKVTAWLSQKGFTGIKPSTGHMFIEFSGTAGLIRNAFHTKIHSYVVHGEAHVANASVPQMPAALAPVVLGIHSLHNFRKKSFMHYSQALAKAKAAGTLKAAFGDGNGLFAVAPGDFAKIYNLPSGLNGSGQTIALVARSNIAVSDINQFGTAFGLANLSNFTAANNIILSGPDPGISPPDDGEATLDVEWSGAVAPGATIKLVVSDIQETTGTDGVDLSAFYIVDNNIAPIMSESFGICEAAADDAFESSLWEEAAAQGITVMVSTGDTGSASCDPDNFPNASDAGLQISGTASTPFNVAVGGTDFNDASNPTTYWNNTAALSTAKGYIPEIPWNDTCASTATAGTLNTVCTSIDPNDQSGLDLSGGGGGASTCGLVNNSGNCLPYPKPSWQTGTGVPAANARNIPDVSLYAAVNSASNNFYIFCLADSGSQNGQPCNLTGPNYNFSGVGGTSVSSPAFAGILALVNQNEVNNTRLKAGEGQGNINYVLYKLAAAQNSSPGTAACAASTAAPNAACTFNDITIGNNSVACLGSFTIENGFGNLSNPNCSTQGLNALGVLVEPTATTTPGWTATAGYDLATGLGSVNATNLVNNWHTVTTNFTQSTTTITSPAPGSVSIGHGQNVNFKVTVAPSSGTGTPTGDVSLVVEPPGPSFGLNFGTLASGQVTIATNELPGGTYPVVAHYAGDGTFAASDSAPFSVTVTKENSTTQSVMAFADPISGNLTQVTSAPYGSTYLFRIDVIGSQNGDNQICSNVAAPGIPCPTGTITLTDTGGVAINDFLNTASGGATNKATLNSVGFLEDRLLGTNGLIGGSHSYNASYAGDVSYNASTAPALAITITPASTGTGVTANGSSSVSVTTGQPVTLTATVGGFNVIDSEDIGSNGAGPTGSVVFKNGSATIATVPVVPTAFSQSTIGTAFATATTTTSFSAAGVQTITATFTTGDTNYTGSASSGAGNATVTVTATQTGSFTVSYSPNPLVLSSATGAAGTLTVKVTPIGGFTGMVAVTPTAASLPPGVSCTPSPLNINVTTAAAVTGQLMCSVTATSTSLTASNAREDRMLDAKVMPPTNAIPPTTNSKAWWSLSAGTGFAALFLMFLPGGRKKYRAALGLGLACLLSLTIGCGGGGGGGTTPPPVLTPTTTHLTVPSGKVATGTPFTFSVSVTGGTPTGQVQLFDGATMIGTAATVAGGTAAPTAPALSVGTHAISAHYLGDATTDPSASGTLNLTVTGSSTIAITTSPVATPAAPAINITVQ
jgi:hypothetical protein